MGISKQVLFVMGLLCYSFSVSAYNWQQHIPNTPLTCQPGSVHYGPLSQNNVSLQQDLTIYGPFSLTNSTLNGALTVYGPATIENSKVLGPCTLYGIMSVTNSTLNTVAAATTDLSLTNTTVNSIVILRNGDQLHNPQQVFLYGTSSVIGTITFEQGNGNVYIAPGATVSGSIIGGKIVTSSSDE